MTTPSAPAHITNNDDSPSGPRILVADDSALIRRTYQFVLELLGYRVSLASNGDDALAELAKGGYDLLLTDYDMPRMDGASLIRAVRRTGNRLPIILISGSVVDGVELPFDIRNEVSMILSKTTDSKSLLAIVTQIVPPAVKSGWVHERP